jgi:hypothetical protein
MSIVPTPSDELATSVRQWVHFDNVAENLNKQLANVRALRSQYETKVIEILTHQNLRNATLRVTGATIQCASRTKPTDLTWSFLEEYLHEYFGTRRDETSDILQFLQSRRNVKTVEYLKKTPVTSSSSSSSSAPVPTALPHTPKK